MPIDPLSAGLAGASTLANLASSNLQYKRQKKLMSLQMDNQKLLNRQGHDLSYDMWLKTNYGAQMQQLKQAGLNPALMYGQGGQGGTTSQSGGGGASGGQASDPRLGMSMDPSLFADVELKKSQARLNDAQANKLGGVDTDLAKGQLEKIIAETTNEVLKGHLMELQSEFQQIENSYRPKVLQMSLDESLQRINNMATTNEIDQGMKDSLILEAQAKAVGQLILNKLNDKELEKKGVEIDKLRADILQGWEKIGQGWQSLENDQQRLKIDTFAKEIAAKYPSILQVGGRITNSIINDLIHLLRGTPREDKVNN